MSTATFTEHDADLFAGEVVLGALRTRTEQLWDAEHAVLDGRPDAVTEMRVITRQLRSTLSGFSRVLDPEVTRPVVAELAWLGRQLGEENDTHAMIKELHRLLSALPREPSVCDVAADVERELGQRSVQGTHVTQAALASRRYAALRQALNQLWPTRPSPRAPRSPRSRSCPRAWPRRCANSTAEWPSPRHCRQGRTATMRCTRHARLTSSCATSPRSPPPVIGKPARRLSRQAKKLQDLLGDYQDAVVTRPVLHKLDAASTATGHPVALYSVLDALEEARIDRVVNKLPHRLGSLHDKGVWLPQRRRHHDRVPAA
jgi:CHAD domain-containing protein